MFVDDAPIFLLSRGFSLCVCVFVCLVLLQGVTHTHTSLRTSFLYNYACCNEAHNYKALCSVCVKLEAKEKIPPSPLSSSLSSPLPHQLERQTAGRENDDKHFHKGSNFLPPPALSGSICFMREQKVKFRRVDFPPQQNRDRNLENANPPTGPIDELPARCWHSCKLTRKQAVRDEEILF